MKIEIEIKAQDPDRWITEVDAKSAPAAAALKGAGSNRAALELNKETIAPMQPEQPADARGSLQCPSNPTHSLCPGCDP